MLQVELNLNFCNNVAFYLERREHSCTIEIKQVPKRVIGMIKMNIRPRHLLAGMCIGCLLYATSGRALWVHLRPSNPCVIHMEENPATPESHHNESDAPPLHDSQRCPICQQLLNLGKSVSIQLSCPALHVEPEFQFDEIVDDPIAGQGSPIPLQPRAPPA